MNKGLKYKNKNKMGILNDSSSRKLIFQWVIDLEEIINIFN